MQRLTSAQAAVVAEQRRIGRTDRQIEKHVGLSAGFLDRPWIIDCSDVFDPVKAAAQREERLRREEAFRRATTPKDRHLRGWRPHGDCVRARPDAAPLRSLPRNPRTQGAG